MSTDFVLRQVLAAPADSPPTVVASSGWLNDTPPSALRAFYAEFGRHFDRALAAAIAILGQPSVQLPSHVARHPAWYPEALRFASWQRGDGTFYVALVHHDRECPVAVEAGLVSQAAITERSQ